LHMPGVITVAMYASSAAAASRIGETARIGRSLSVPLLASRGSENWVCYGTSIVATSTVDRCPSITTIPLSVTK
jgi:hypothetical protein